MKTSRALLTAAALAAVLPTAAVAAEPPAATVNEYVALGDSWAADATLSQLSTAFTPVPCVKLY
ncbi:hypothetical protein ACFXG3_35025, partial [Nocardia tengchongensis]